MQEKKRKNYYVGMEQRKRWTDNTIGLLVVILGCMCLVPIFWMVRTSLMSNAAIAKYPPRIIPEKILFSNYPETLKIFPFLLYLRNTMSIIIPALIGTVATSCISAYALARLKFKGRSFIFALVIGSMLMPSAVTLIPIFIGWSNLGFYDTYIPLIVPAFLGGGAFNIFLIRQFMLTIPRDLDEAALIDGASRMRTLWSIIVPMIKPALIVVALMTFIIYWNDILGPVVYLGSPEKYTISYGLNTFRGSFGTNWRSIMAASTLTVIPAFLMYLFGQKYFIEGIVLTGIKG